MIYSIKCFKTELKLQKMGLVTNHNCSYLTWSKTLTNSLPCTNVSKQCNIGLSVFNLETNKTKLWK